MREAQPFCALFTITLLAVACTSGTSTPLPSDGDVTPTPGPSLVKTTWVGSLYEELDLNVSANTNLLWNIETQADGQVTGFFWHKHGWLTIDGYEVPEFEALPVSGAYTFDRHIVMEGSLAGHVLKLDGEVDEHSYLIYAEVTLDGDYYTEFCYFDAFEYIELVYD